MPCKNIIYTDLDSAQLLAEDPIIGGMFYDDNKKGLINISNQLGYGADTKEDFLEIELFTTIK